jgi:2-(1,2-epoxy-1,2-dihydrophenyl)acetyl-CoA isomerase
MTYGTIRFELRDGVAHLTLNRPEQQNAMNLEMTRELSALVASWIDDPAIRAVLIRGAGANFCVGGDVKAFGARVDALPPYVRPMATELHLAVARLARLDVPVVAAVQGAAAGAGFSLACGADIVLAADSARFTLAYTKIGLNPDGGATYFLPRIVGARRALELMISNRILSAAEARDLGIVTTVVPANELDAEAEKLAASIASGATRAMGAAKRLVRESWSNTLETQLERETVEVTRASASADGKEGIRAFVERRAPRFRGE